LWLPSIVLDRPPAFVSRVWRRYASWYHPAAEPLAVSVRSAYRIGRWIRRNGISCRDTRAL